MPVIVYANNLMSYGGKNMAEHKDKKIVFSEEIDSSINGFALGISFVLLALFVEYFKIFNNAIVEIVVAIVLLVLGIAGTVTEIGRIKKDDIRGLDDLMLGIFLAVVSIIVILKIHNVYYNIGLFVILLLGTFGMVKGLLEVLYSLKLRKRKSKNAKVEIMKIIVALTEIIALIVAIIQLMHEIV